MCARACVREPERSDNTISILLMKKWWEPPSGCGGMWWRGCQNFCSQSHPDASNTVLGILLFPNLQLQTSSFQALCCCLVTVAIETRHTAAEAGVGTTGRKESTVLMEFDHMVWKLSIRVVMWCLGTLATLVSGCWQRLPVEFQPKLLLLSDVVGYVGIVGFDN